MAVDKNLFLYDLAVVAIMKDEEPYVKEWLDYHLLAGVDHFYIYDHESSAQFKEILQPYIDAEIVTYIFYPDQYKQNDAYNDAINHYKFFCRYMAFIDGDEFIFPQNNLTIQYIVDEVFKAYPDAAEINMNWIMFGSNHQRNADYTRGVLERFTRRRANEENSVKSILNPRRVKFFTTPHFSVKLEGALTYKLETDSIAINHYYTKSFEEYMRRKNRGCAFYRDPTYDEETFNKYDFNEIFDDSILKYREARQNTLQIDRGDNFIKFFAKIKQVDHVQLMNALVQNLYPIMFKDLPQDFFKNKMETFLVCRELAAFLQTNSLTEKAGKFFEELALEAIYKTILTDMPIIDASILLNELPKLTTLNYPVVRKIYTSSIVVANNLKIVYAEQGSYIGNFEFWNQANEFARLANMLETLNPFKDN